MHLIFQPINDDTKSLMPEAVYQFIQKFDKDKAIQVAEINPDFADGESLSREYGIPYDMEVNCLVVIGSRGDEKRYAALLVPYGKRAKTNATVKRPLDASKVAFADLEEVLNATGMEFGSITPVGLPEDWSILIDSSLLEQDNLIIGGGLVKSKLMIPSELLDQLPNSLVIDGLAKD